MKQDSAMPMKYLNPYTDFGFKKLFGEEASKDLLQDFLNQLLPSYHQVVELTFKNPEKIPGTAKERKAVFDIYCQNAQCERFYFIAILDFQYDEKEEEAKFRRDVCLKDQDGDVFYDKLHFKVLQMPLFKKTRA